MGCVGSFSSPGSDSCVVTPEARADAIGRVLEEASLEGGLTENLHAVPILDYREAVAMRDKWFVDYARRGLPVVVRGVSKSPGWE